MGEPRPGLPEPLKYVLGLLLITALAWGASAYVERAGRTAEAEIEILLIDTYHAPGKGSEGSVSIRYRYVVNGIARDATAVRNWSIAEVQCCQGLLSPGRSSQSRPGEVRRALWLSHRARSGRRDS